MFSIRTVVIACLLLIPAFWVYSETPKGPANEVSKSVLITAAKAEQRPVERAVSIVGELQAEEEAIVKSEVKGKVREIHKNLGDDVQKGEIIARIDSEEYKIALEQATQALKEAQSKEELARLNWERADGLFNKGLISEGEHDLARETLKGLGATVNLMHASLEMAAKRLRDTDIVAPFSGVIKEKFANVGDSVDDKSAIAAIVNLIPLKLKASIPERAAGIIKIGMKVVISMEAYPGKVFEGSVIRVSPALDFKTRTLTIEASFANRDRTLKPGFFADGRVVTNKADKAIFVPEESVVTFAGIKKVFVIENNTATERLVKLGDRIENIVEIRDGLKEGETVATSALNKLSTGVRVEVKK